MAVVSKAIARYVRMSPRKVRYVIDNLRGLSVLEAEKVLLGINKRARIPVYKVLRAAVSAALNRNLPIEALYVEKITADPGPIWKRWRAGTMGRAMPIRKRTSHITVELSVRFPETSNESSHLSVDAVQEAQDKGKVNTQEVKEGEEA